MRRRIPIYIAILFFAFHGNTRAQKVLYSPFIDDEFNVIGKTGNFYWIEKKVLQKVGKKHAPVEMEVFEIYDTRMNVVNIVEPSVTTDTILKEYFLTNKNYIDHFILVSDRKKTSLQVTRYSPEGEVIADHKTIMELPFNEDGNSFLFTRSEDKNKMLLVCFESTSTKSRMHAILFDRNWTKLSYTIYTHRFLTQPLIQDDFTSYPIEHFNSNPLKLTNDGEWLMASPSRTNNNFLLFHFNGKDTSIVYKEIKLPKTSTWEDVALSVDEKTHEVQAGILSIFRYPTLKNVQVIHYSLSNHEISFDSAYRFNTLMAYRLLNENMIHESFITVPGKGFMLLKEYGRPYPDIFDNNQYINPGGLEAVFADNSISNTVSPPLINSDGYTRYNLLGGPRALYSRGDLCMFYFPARNNDTCWSGIINKEQVTEFNSPYLSYVVVPAKERIFLLYNSAFRNNNELQFGNTTILDYQGYQMTGEGLIYSKLYNTLNFQQSRQIADEEVAIPYDNFKRKGFAIVRF
ncbi:MAG: hypothetical protein JST75_01375 [Bacteroidetes bacterium]|nr:hypothetical protein [Bacteroidota bacterium]